MNEGEEVTYGREKRAADFRGYRVEFVAGPFKHNLILAVLILPCLIPVLVLSGKFTLTIIFLGAVFAYILDYLNIRGLTVVTLWTTLICVWLSLYFSNLLLVWQSLFNVFILTSATWFLFLIGLWGTVQFKWFQIYLPELSIVAERLLLGLTPFVVVPLYFNTLVGLQGVSNAPMLLSALMAIIHHFFFKRRKSSWKVALVQSAKQEEYVQGALESLIYTKLCILIPYVLYVLAHHRILEWSWTHVLNLAALVALPLYYLMYDPLQSLWFLLPQPTSAKVLKEHFLFVTRPVLLILSHVVLQHWFQHRVVTSTYGHLLLGMPPPYNTIAITIGFYCFSLTALLSFQLVKLSEKRETGLGVAGRWIAVLFLSIGGSTAFAMVLGVPRFILPFSALSASCITAYCLDRRNLNNFMLFAMCTSIILMWWMWKSFSFLHVKLEVLASELTLQTLSLLIMGLFIQSCLLFPISFHAYEESEEARIFFSFLLWTHGCLFAFTEHVLYAQPEGFYSVLLVVLSSLIGVAFLYKCHENKKLTFNQASLTMSPYISKIFVFLAHSSFERDDFTSKDVKIWQATELVILFVVVMVCAYILLQFQFEKWNNKKRARPNTAIMYMAFALVAVILSRKSIVHAFIQLTMGGIGVLEIASTRYLGAIIFIWGLSVLPISLNYMAHLQLYRKVNFSVIIFGAVVGLMAPAWSLVGTTTDLDEDIHLYTVSKWVGWAGTLAGTMLICTILNVVDVSHNIGLRYAWWGVISLVSAVSFSLTFLPFLDFHTLIFVTGIFGLSVMTIDLSHFPRATNQFQPALVVYLALAAMSVLAYVSVTRTDYTKHTNLWYAIIELEEISTVSVISLIAAANILIAVIVKCKLIGMPLVRSAYTKPDKSIVYVSARNLLPLGLIVNVSTMVGFLAMAILNIMINESNTFVFVLLSSLLLLLHEDEYLFVAFNPEKQRYVPPLVNIEVLLGMSALVELYSNYLMQAKLGWNATMLLCCVPCHVILWNYLNTFKNPKLGHALLAEVLGVISILGTNMHSIRWLALVGASGIGAIFFTATLLAKRGDTIL